MEKKKTLSLKEFRAIGEKKVEESPDDLSPRLLDSVEWVDRTPLDKNDRELLHCQGDVKITSPQVAIHMEDKDEMKVNVNDEDGQPTYVDKAIAKRVVDLIADGKSVTRVRQGVNNLKLQLKTRPEINLAIKQLVETYHQEPGVRRMMVRAAQNKILMEGMDEGGDRKLALEANKQIMQDPDVGLSSGALVTVNVDVGALETVLKGAPKLEGFEPMIEEKDSNDES